MQQKCGIYAIEQIGTGKRYIGSSKFINSRWSKHRMELRKGKHHSPYLQNSWNKYGEAAFSFVVIEECDKADLLIREQHYLDTENPVFNTCPKARSREGSKLTPEQAKRFSELRRAEAALITHCPHGHEYTEENTYRNAEGTKFCRQCNRDRAMANIAAETPEQREERQQRMLEYNQRTKEQRAAQQKAYAAANREKIKAYHTSHAKEINENRRKRLADPERHARHLEQKRQWYARKRAALKG